MQASLTFPPQGDLISGDNPIYIGNVNRGESRTVNWTLTFTASGVFNVDVNASGYRQDTGEYVEKHGYATVTVVDTPPPVGGISIPVDKPGLLAPYIDVASTIAAATVVTAIYVKCIRRRKKRR